MKRLGLSDTIMYNILYKGQVLHSKVNIDDCAVLLEEIALDFYENGNYDINEIKLEKVNGNDERW